MTALLLEVDRLTSGYEGNPVLRDISLHLNEGSVVTIIGPNGHGKTTLLRTISGLVRATKGDIRFDGKSIRSAPVDRIVGLGIVHVPQGDLVFPEMSVRDNLLMGAYLPAAYAKSAERLEAIYELLPRLKERQKQVASTLSGGERRMLGIGRGLMSGGRILMLDEPSLGLAPIMIDQIYKVIRNLKDEGRTIIIVEENASRVRALAERVYLLDHGSFVWNGPPEELEQNRSLIATYLGT